jgi:hypothetical protein
VAIGWIAGLSISPVASTIIAALVGVAVAAVAALTGLRQANGVWAPNINPVPIAVFTVCLAVGATGGIYVRLAQWLGPNELQSIVDQWMSLDAGLNRSVVANDLYVKWRKASESLPAIYSRPVPYQGLAEFQFPLSSFAGIERWQDFCTQLSKAVSGTRGQLQDLINKFNVSVLMIAAPKLGDEDLVAAANAFCKDIAQQ